YDPLATLAFLAARTARLRLVTHVLVLPYHHPLAIAKRYGTLDRLSGGRLVLGVGVGTLEEEFHLLGAQFAGRGPRYEDALRALRAAFGRPEPTYAGTHYRFRDLLVDPCGVQAAVPIWLGGRTPRSLRRALALADGWDPFGLSLDDLTALLARARGWREWREPFEVVLTPDELYDPTDQGEREALVALVARYRAIGATVLHLRFRNRSLEHYLEQLGAITRGRARAACTPWSPPPCRRRTRTRGCPSRSRASHARPRHAGSAWWSTTARATARSRAPASGRRATRASRSSPRLTAGSSRP